MSLALRRGLSIRSWVPYMSAIGVTMLKSRNDSLLVLSKASTECVMAND